MKPIKTLLPLLAVLALFAVPARAQLTLPSATLDYTQDFNSLGSGVPTGWGARTGASASSLGTAATINTSQATAAGTTGQFANFSSYGLADGNADRALGIRQTGAFGDPGAAFTLQIANTLGLTNFSLALDVGIISSQPRSTTWTIQWGLGTSPTSFTTLGTYTDPGAVGSSRLTFTNITGIANQSGNVWIRIVALSASTGSGNRDTFGIDDFSLTYDALSSGNNSTISASSSNVAFGRVMQNSSNPTNNITLSKTGSDPTTYSVTAAGGAVVADAGTSFVANSATDQISVGVDRATTGAKTGTVTVDNLAADSAGTGQGSADANDVINVTGTVVANRTINASTVDLGKVLVGATTGTQASSLTTTGDDANYTRVTVSGSQASNNGVTVAAGTSQLFDGASDTTTRNVTGNFSTSGSKSVDVTLSRTGEGLTGESVNAVTVHATADVYQAASLATNNSAPLATGDTITVSNANTTDGGQRAAAKIVGKAVTGDGWTVSGLDEDTVIAQNTTASATASFNEGGKLNGTHTGTLLLNFQHNDQTIRGTSANDLGSRSWSFSHVISGVTASSGEATVESGKGYAGFGLKNDAGKGTEVGLLAGISSGESTISMSFDSTAPGFGVAGNDADRVSDIVNLTGSGSDLIVLQLTYDETAIGAAGYSSEEELRLGYLSGGKWVMAGSANAGSNANVAQLGFLGSFAAFQNIYGTNLSNYIGAFGVDTAGNTAWAVINHNSEFAVVPEPGTYALLALGGMMVLVFRRRLSSRRS